MIVVADTSPLNYLILLGKPEILVNLYQRVAAPTAVLTELRHPDAPEAVRSWATTPPSWLQVREVQRIDSTLPAELGAGEREAISLALEIHANLILIDERAGREHAQARKLTVAGTLAVLLRAGELGLVDFPDALDRIQRLGFRVSSALRSAMLKKYRQARN